MEVSYVPASATFENGGSVHGSFQPDQVSGTVLANGIFVGKVANSSTFNTASSIALAPPSQSTVVTAEFERTNQLLTEARKKDAKSEDRYSQLAEAVRLLVLAVFGLALNLTIVVVGLPIQWTWGRLVRLSLLCTAVREWLRVPLLPRVLDFGSAVVSRTYNFAVWLVETILRRPGLVHNTRAYFAGVWRRALQQRSVYEAYYTQKRSAFYAELSNRKDQLVTKKNETVQLLNERTTQALDSTKKEAYVLLNKSHQLVQDRKNIPAGRYVVEIVQLAFVIVLHAVSLVTNVVAYPVVSLSQRVSSRKTAPEVVTFNPAVLKKTE